MRRVDTFELWIMWFVMLMGMLAIPVDLLRAHDRDIVVWSVVMGEVVAYLALVQCVMACTVRIRAGDHSLSWYYVGYWWCFSYLIFTLAILSPSPFNIFLCAVDVCFSIVYTYLTAEQKAQKVERQ